MLNGKLCRVNAYEKFHLLRKSDVREIFLMKASTREEKNLKKFYVHTHKNDGSIYDDFCEDLECLAECLGLALKKTEQAIFSNGGALDKFGCWRPFVS